MNKSLRSRMGAAVRRSTSALSIIRPSTPSRSNTSSEIDASSNHKPSLDLPIPPSHSDVVRPSPIIESPAVGLPPAPLSPSAGDKAIVAESSASVPSADAPSDPVYEQQAEVTSPPAPAAEESSSVEEPKLAEDSKLSEEPAAPSTEPAEPPAAVETQPTSEPPAESQVPTEVYPSPILSHASGPGAFVDEPEEMSAASSDYGQVKEEGRNSEQLQDVVEAPVDPTVDPIADAVYRDQTVESVGVVAPIPPTEATTARPAPGAFNDDLDHFNPAEHSIPTPDSAIAILPPVDNANPLPIDDEFPKQDADAKPPPIDDEIPKQDADSHAPSYFTMPEPQAPIPMTQVVPSFEHGLQQNVWGYVPPTSVSSEITPRPVTTGRVVVVNGMTGYGKKKAMDDDRISMFSFGDGASPAPDFNENILQKEEEASRAGGYEDPFADPHYPSTFVAPAHATPPIVTMPEPSQVQTAHSLNMPSTQTLHDLGLDETRHLLDQGAPNSYGLSNVMASRSSSTQLLQKYGWLEHVLPDGSTYFTNPSVRVVTDIDLHSSSKIHNVMEFLEVTSSGNKGLEAILARGQEIWLRDTAVTKHNIVLAKNWVDHTKRRVSLHPPSSDIDEDIVGNEDRLDAEYRYWSYIEAHPVHVSIPVSARNEALEALTWSYTDSLLPTSPTAPHPPFSSEECNQLMGLLRSFGEPTGQLGTQSTLQTRIISKILIRVVQWRQTHFRPEKSLPTDANTSPPRSGSHFPIRRALADLFISCFCFGIPYVFFERSHRRLDVESGSYGFRNSAAGPVLVFGACTCLVAAIVLSASVTFLSLPGLDDFARIATVVSILFSAGSMASSVIALFRYKADMERAMLITATGEGMMFEYRRGMILSLPMVFLVYSIIGFVAGLVLYSFKGTGINDPDSILRPFEEHTRWTAVGVLGGVCFVLLLSLLFNKK